LLSLILLKIDLRKLFFTTYGECETGIAQNKKRAGECAIPSLGKEEVGV
jgi:hypothetical protein